MCFSMSIFMPFKSTFNDFDAMPMMVATHVAKAVHAKSVGENDEPLP